MLSNRCVLQQYYVDCEITDTLLKKGTKQHKDGWDTHNKAWSHMVLRLSHAEGGFGVTFNDVTKVSHYHSSTSSLRLPLCGMRALSPMLILLS